MVEERYKQSEVGFIPSDWNCLPITDLLRNQAGSIKIGPFGSQLHKKYLTTRGYKVYGQSNVYQKDISIGDRYISEDRFKLLQTCEVKEGDFLISMMGTIGKCYIVPGDFLPGIIDSHLIRIRFDSSKANSEYILHLFQSPIIISQVEKLSVGGIMEGLSSKIIKNLCFPIPEVSEQNKIAKVLSDLDILIKNLEKLIAKKCAIKTAVMQQLLTGKTRLPGFTEKWVTKRLGDICTFSKGGGLSKKNINISCGIPAIPYTSIFTDFDEIFMYDQVNKFTKEKNLVTIDSPHLLIAGSSNMLENVGKVSGYISKNKIAIGGDVIIASTDEDIPFLSFLLNTEVHRRKIVDLSQGSTIRHVYPSTFNEYAINIPNERKEQRSISQVIFEVMNEIKSLDNEVRKIKMIKNGMMQELLTGRTRLI